MREKVRGLVAGGALALAALLVCPAASTGSEASEPVTAEFNHVGLYASLFVAGDFDELVHTPSNGDPVVVQGQYTDAEGNFTVPKEGGLAFPPLVVDFGPVTLNGEFELASDGSGKYDEATGHLRLDLDLAVKIGIDDLDAFSSQIGVSFGSGELLCEVSPLEVMLSTDGAWPHPGKAYENKTELIDGAVSGAWRKSPEFIALKGEQADCSQLRGLINPIGGLWLANSTEPIDEMPPSSLTCPGYVLPSPGPCKGPPPGCSKNTVGQYPHCYIVDPMTELTKLTVGPKKRQLIAGKSFNLRVRVKARVGLGPDRFRIKLRSSNRQVKIAKAVMVKLTGDLGIATVKVKATGKARGKATVVASYPGFKAITKVTVKKKAKKRKRGYA